MKEEINQLETLLTRINELVEQHIEIEQIDLEEFDTIQETAEFPFEGAKKHMEAFRKTIVLYKNDRFFYEKELPKIELLLNSALMQLKNIRNDNTEFTSIPKRDKPNKDIVQLLKQEILTTKSIISGSLQGLSFFGHLTEDGFIEIEKNGAKMKFSSLRKAVYQIWKIGLPISQWEFWKVGDIPLENFRQRINREL